MKFEFTKPDDYRRAKDAAPIAYLPWGSHEWHGRQNPLGLDTLKAEAMCKQLCAETGGVVFPGVYLGHDSMKTHGFDGSLEFSRECLELLATEYLEQLVDEGFQVIVILMGHYGKAHHDALVEVVSDFNDNQDRAVAWAFPDYEMITDDGFPGDHAGRAETSYMMYLYPELVDLSRLPRDGELDWNEQGIGGEDPRKYASAKWGRDAVNALVRNVAPKIRGMLESRLQAVH